MGRRIRSSGLGGGVRPKGQKTDFFDPEEKSTPERTSNIGTGGNPLTRSMRDSATAEPDPAPEEVRGNNTPTSTQRNVR